MLQNLKISFDLSDSTLFRNQCFGTQTPVNSFCSIPDDTLHRHQTSVMSFLKSFCFLFQLDTPLFHLLHSRVSRTCARADMAKFPLPGQFPVLLKQCNTDQIPVLLKQRSATDSESIAHCLHHVLHEIAGLFLSFVPSGQAKGILVNPIMVQVGPDQEDHRARQILLARLQPLQDPVCGIAFFMQLVSHHQYAQRPLRHEQPVCGLIHLLTSEVIEHHRDVFLSECPNLHPHGTVRLLPLPGCLCDEGVEEAGLSVARLSQQHHFFLEACIRSSFHVSQILLDGKEPTVDDPQRRRVQTPNSV
mmetsp:Transcript_28273/g.44078  ORF Transcript_28273/g.44078 Transcript_28273/m.44078 type:complete len:303 (-) Transcript_28273:957-1865(-)